MFSFWNVSDYLTASQVVVSVVDIGITSFIAIWVVRSIQKKIDNEKVLKEYISKELLLLRSDLRSYIEKIISSKVKPKTIKREHHLLSVRIQDLLSIMNIKYGVDKKYLNVYRLYLMKIIEADKTYEQAYLGDKAVILEQKTVLKLHDLMIKHDHRFNDLLLQIYEMR